MTSVTLVPQRKVCPSIPGTAKGIIMSQPGVTAAEVHYEERSITVTFDEGKTTAEALAAAVGKEIGIALRPGM